MIHIIGMGYNYMHPNGWRIERPDGLPYYLLLYIRNPFHVVINNSNEYHSEPAYILYRKGDSQLFYRENEPYADDWLHFESSDEDLDLFFQNLDIPYSSAITLSAALDISTVFQDLDMEFHKRGQHHDLIMDMKLKSMFYKFSDIYHEETLASGQLNQFRQRFNELRGHIYHSNNAVQIQSVDVLAAQMHLSTSYFQHIYKALFGVSVLHDVITARIEYAGYLMQNSGDPINRIAAACGYDNIEHFTRQFRKLKGYSPRQYQKLALQIKTEP
ncbi:MAG: helix-turn-helix transcriptional regulator [Butyrivibrio sp.]|nr:helix-turn-helix transcriptional regulator [Butyrivibrio sp.]